MKSWREPPWVHASSAADGASAVDGLAVRVVVVDDVEVEVDVVEEADGRFGGAICTARSRDAIPSFASRIERLRLLRRVVRVA